MLLGDFVRPGSHVDLVGGFTPDMWEADDALLRKAKVFVNSRASAIEHSGDICQPQRNAVLSVDDIGRDLYALVSGTTVRNPQDITFYKNAGGAHIDLMVAHSFLERL